jgi:hypothetical protein
MNIKKSGYMFRLGLRLLLALGAATALALPAHAQRIYLSDVEILTIGSHLGFTFVLRPDKLPTQGCTWGNAYCSSSDPECKSRMAVALLAKASNKRVGVWFDLDYSPAVVVEGKPMCRITYVGVD